MTTRITSRQRTQLSQLLSRLGPKFPWSKKDISSPYNFRRRRTYPQVIFHPYYSIDCDGWVLPISNEKMVMGFSHNFFSHSSLAQDTIFGHELAHHYQYLQNSWKFLYFTYYRSLGRFTLYNYLVFVNWFFVSLYLIYFRSIFLLPVTILTSILYLILLLNRRYELQADLYMAQYLGVERVIKLFKEYATEESIFRTIYQDLIGSHPSAVTIYRELIKIIPP